VLKPGIDLQKWKASAGDPLLGRLKGSVVCIQEESRATEVVNLLTAAGDVPVLSLSVPFPLENGPPAELPAHLAQINPSQLALSISFTRFSDSLAAGIKWALKAGHVVEIEIKSELKDGEEGVEELFSKVYDENPQDGEKKAIVISNVLPPPSSIEIPLVKLLANPDYNAFQSHIGQIAFNPNLYIKFLPPQWNAPTPQSPTRPDTKISRGEDEDEVPGEEEKNEWKKRIKMYLGPVIEAFGFSRIIFGSSPISTTGPPSNASDWYILAKESLVELGVEQADVDAVFGGNARQVYGV
jgi:hypothetical protein